RPTLRLARFLCSFVGLCHLPSPFARSRWRPRFLSSFSRAGSSGAISATLHCWASLTGKGIPSPLHLFLVDGKARLQVVRQGGRVVLGAGVQPEALGSVAPRSVDGPLEEIPSQALADELRQHPELHQFDLGLHPPHPPAKA